MLISFTFETTIYMSLFSALVKLIIIHYNTNELLRTLYQCIVRTFTVWYEEFFRPLLIFFFFLCVFFLSYLPFYHLISVGFL